jgi:negative regulator of sigma E activity
MNNLLQPGNHPDAEQLSAFTDNALPPHEQQQMLAHLNTCRDCRSRVYLVQQINPVESQQSTSAAFPLYGFLKWFSGWRLAFPATAFACIVLLTIYLRKTPAPSNHAVPNYSASNSPAQPPLSAAPLAAPASPVSASPKSAPIPRPKRPQPATSDLVADSAAAPPAAPNAQAAPRSPLPPQSTTVSVSVNGIGGILGTITDPSGAGVPKAEVIATNTDTGVQTAKLTSGTGTYLISSLQPGPYNVEVVAKGFQRLLQENVTVDNASVVGLPLKLTIGGESTTVTVTDAPAMLNTTDATLGGTIENQLYSSLPLSMNGGPRDPTAFQYLMPGVQTNANASNAGANNGNSGIYGGTGSTNLNENYLEGMPASNLSTQNTPTPTAKIASTKPLPTLPSKLPALSVVERAGRTFAIDTAGTLYSSDDAGVAWHLIPTQWQGRALAIRLVPSPSAQQPGAATNSAGVSSHPQAVVLSFELTTNSGARYTSTDGQTWYRK